MTDPIDFHAAITEAMARRGWNANQLAVAAGVANPQVYLFLSGKRGLRDDALGRLLAALGIGLKMPRGKAVN